MANMNGRKWQPASGADAADPRGRPVQCLHCGPPGRLTRVPVLVRDARDAVRVRGEIYGPGGLLPLDAQAVRTTAIGRTLAAPRRPASTTAPIMAAGMACLFALACLDSTSLPSGILTTAGSMIILGLVASLIRTHRRRRATATRDADRAQWLWQRCWYCHRCGHVSLLAPTVATQLIPVNRLVPALLELSRQLTWQPKTPD